MKRNSMLSVIKKCKLNLSDISLHTHQNGENTNNDITKYWRGHGNTRSLIHG